MGFALTRKPLRRGRAPYTCPSFYAMTAATGMNCVTLTIAGWTAGTSGWLTGSTYSPHPLKLAGRPCGGNSARATRSCDFPAATSCRRCGSLWQSGSLSGGARHGRRAAGFDPASVSAARPGTKDSHRIGLDSSHALHPALLVLHRQPQLGPQMRKSGRVHGAPVQNELAQSRHPILGKEGARPSIGGPQLD
jgi:hypothetical protein